MVEQHATPPEAAGLSFFRELLRTGEPAAPICPALNFRLSAAEHGSTEFTGWPELQFTNPSGVVHGGYLAVILSSAMSCAVHTTLGEGEHYTTTNMSVNLTRALKPEGGPVVASGAVVHRGRGGATAEGRIIDREGRLIAHGTTTCIVFPARREDQLSD
jgi:uncharacterized protein (TIGR00369 family)